jgi:hypothetical protein
MFYLVSHPKVLPQYIKIRGHGTSAAETNFALLFRLVHEVKR